MKPFQTGDLFSSQLLIKHSQGFISRLWLLKALSVTSGEDSPGLRRSNLISWYLGEMESEIESEAELIEKKNVLEKVLDRLIHHVSSCQSLV